MDDSSQRRYWRANGRLVAILLGVWFLVSYGAGIVLVESLNEVQILGFPLGFWFSQQGSIFVFIGLILAYCLVMDRIERRFRERGE